MPVREEVHLEWPPRCERHEYRPVIAAHHDPLATVDLCSEHVGEEVSPSPVAMLACALQRTLHPRRHEGVCVDLSMGVAEGDADLLAAIFEAKNLLNARGCTQRPGSVDPRLENRSHPRRRECRERRFVIGGEADDLASADTGTLEKKRRGV